MVDMKSFLVLSCTTLACCQAFAPATTTTTTTNRRSAAAVLASKATTDAAAVYPQLDERTGKPTGISFLPAETIERALAGSPVEKVKLEKDGTAAFVDVYEYARKIREGEMTWEEVDKADLDSVRLRASTTREVEGLVDETLLPRAGRVTLLLCIDFHPSSLTLYPSHTFNFSEIKVGRYVTSWQTHTGSVHDAPQSTEWYCQCGSDALLRRLC